VTGRRSMAGCSTSALTVATAEQAATAATALHQVSLPRQPDLRGGGNRNSTASDQRTPLTHAQATIRRI
jgi:hypothetical protein